MIWMTEMSMLDLNDDDHHWNMEMQMKLVQLVVIIQEDGGGYKTRGGSEHSHARPCSPCGSPRITQQSSQNCSESKIPFLS